MIAGLSIYVLGVIGGLMLAKPLRQWYDREWASIQEQAKKYADLPGDDFIGSDEFRRRADDE